ncbi:MAG: VWA domain-containing protein, partial [Bacteroidota bacterium]
MKSPKYLMMLLALILTLAACKKDKDSSPVKFSELVITIEEQYETPPSRVSVFFRVEDTAGNPVSGLTEENFTLFEQGRNDDNELLLSKDEATRVISDNRQVFSYNNILVLDLSGSVLNNSLEQLKASANNFVDDVIAVNGNSSASLGVWWFNGRNELHELIDFTSDKDALHEAINSIDPSISTDNSTDLFGAVLKSTQLAKSKLAENEITGILSAVSVVVFTDGTDQAARYSREEAYTAVDNAPQGIHFYTIGLGNEIDDTVLKRIGKSSSVFADDTAALDQKFEEIAGLISDEANSYYLFEYCTPKRDGSGISDLHMVVKKDGAIGRKITQFDATGFEDD